MGQQSLQIMNHRKTQPSCYNRTTQDYSNGQIVASDRTRNLYETTVCFISSDARQTVDELLSGCLELRLLHPSYDAIFQRVSSKKQQKERNSAHKNTFQKSKIQFTKGDKSNECVKCKLWGAEQEQTEILGKRKGFHYQQILPMLQSLKGNMNKNLPGARTVKTTLINMRNPHIGSYMGIHRRMKSRIIADQATSLWRCHYTHFPLTVLQLQLWRWRFRLGPGRLGFGEMI